VTTTDESLECQLDRYAAKDADMTTSVIVNTAPADLARRIESVLSEHSDQVPLAYGYARNQEALEDFYDAVSKLPTFLRWQKTVRTSSA
jgi:hypothetical protein